MTRYWDTWGNPFSIFDNNPRIDDVVRNFTAGYPASKSASSDALAGAAFEESSCPIAAAYRMIVFAPSEREIIGGLTRSRALSEREQMNSAASIEWQRGKRQRALRLYEATVARYPRDIVALVQVTSLALTVGDMSAWMRAATASVRAAPDVAFAHSLYAFGLQELGDYDAAMQEVERALKIDPSDASAHHAMAHVLWHQGEFEVGSEWLVSQSSAWADSDVATLTHNWFHTALFMWRTGRHEEALSILDTVILPHCHDLAALRNAIGLLVRLEGSEPLEHRWQLVGGMLEGREVECGRPFLELLVLYALVRSGRYQRASQMLLKMMKYSLSLTGEDRKKWFRTVVPMAIAITWRSDGMGSESHLKMPTIADLGASIIERECFDFIL